MPENNDRLHPFLDQYPDIEIFEVMLMDLCGVCAQMGDSGQDW